MEKPLPICNILEETKYMFKNRTRMITIKKISKETGLSNAWLGQFLTYKDPGINKVFVLHSYLSDLFEKYNRKVKKK